MAISRRFFFATIAEVALILSALVQMTSADTYVVGDRMGWDIPTYGANPYATWAAQHTFRVGDNIVFNFNSGTHTVAEVSADTYNNCNSGNTVNLQTYSPATFTLTSPGTKYYICTVHCSQGMKFSLNVVGNNILSPPGTYLSPPIFYLPPPPFRFNHAPTNVASFLILFSSIGATCLLF